MCYPAPMILPLKGITVLDLTRVLSGPFATQQLVDLGAEIIKIEHPSRGDDTRRFGPPFVEGESTYFMSINRGKKSVAVDLKKEKGRDLVLAMAQKADVVIENFRPGTAKRLGLGHAELQALKPSLVTCSISGYGSGGVEEFEGAPGYDAILQAVSGLMALTGEPEDEPTKVGVAIGDMVAGLYAAQGILAALVQRGISGKGHHVEISMQDALTSLLTYQAGIYFATGHNPARMGNAHPSICPYETVQTKDGMYALAVGNDGQFERLVELLSLNWLKSDARFESNRNRVENREALMSVLGPKFKEKTKKEWDKVLRDANIPGGPVLEVQDALTHPQLTARGTVLTHQHQVAGAVRTIASPVRFDKDGPNQVEAPPLLGQHTRSVLTEWMGMSSEAIDQLVTDEVLAEAAHHSDT